METKIILPWRYFNNLEYYEKEPIIDESETQVNIYVALKDDEKRTCPFCGSINAIVKEKVVTRANCSKVIRTHKPVFINTQKRRYKCKDCGKSFTQKDNLNEKKKRTTNDLRWDIMQHLQAPVTFSHVAKNFNLSEKTVLNIFDEMVFLDKIDLPETLAIDEKKFNSDYGKYLCVLSDAMTGKIYDLLPSRRLDYLADYFRKIPASEREKIKYVTTDMNTTYRRIIKAFCPKAYHIIDHFHVTKLFTDAITKIRCFELKKYEDNKKSKIYKFLKKDWKIFLLNPFTKLGQSLLQRTFYDENGFMTDYEEQLKWAFSICPNLLSIYSIYLDYLQYVDYGKKIEEIEKTLEFLINKLTKTNIAILIKVGKTLEEFKEELIITFSELNESHLSNARAESANNNIGTIIKNAYGFRNFERLRKRVLWIQQKTEVF